MMVELLCEQNPLFKHGFIVPGYEIIWTNTGNEKGGEKSKEEEEVRQLVIKNLIKDRL